MRTDHLSAQRPVWRLLTVVILLTLLIPTVIALSAKTGLAEDNVTQEQKSNYLPLISRPEDLRPPQFVTNIPLPQAMCPNAVGFNTRSEYVYIANNYSNNVTVFRDRAFITDIATGEWPTAIATAPNSARTYVTNLHTGVSVLENAVQVALVPRDYEPYGVAFNPVNGYVYVTDLDSKLMIINDTSLVKTLRLTDPDTGRGAGWLRPVLADPTTGLVYLASWDFGRLYVIQGTELLTSVRLGWGPLNMAIDPARRYLYVAHSDPNAVYPHDISVVQLDTLTVTPVDLEPGKINQSRDVAVDPLTGIAYVTNPKQDSVTLLHGSQVFGVVKVGKEPWGIGVNPRTGYVIVTNRGDNTVTVMRSGAVVDTIPVAGRQPFAVGVDTIHGDYYIANRGEEYKLFTCRNGSVTILH